MLTSSPQKTLSTHTFSLIQIPLSVPRQNLPNKPRRMIREITHVKRNDKGDIVALCNPRKFWSPRDTKAVISDIESGACRYFETDVIGLKVYVEVIDDPIDGKYLRSEMGDSIYCSIEKLPDLPDC